MKQPFLSDGWWFDTENGQRAFLVMVVLVSGFLGFGLHAMLMKLGWVNLW